MLLAGFGLSLRRVREYWTLATDGVALVEDRAGITFGVELYIPWGALEAVVDIASEGCRTLEIYSGRDWIDRSSDGCCRMPCATRSSCPQCASSGSGSWYGPEFSRCHYCRQGDVPESSVSIPDLSSLSQQWPPAVISLVTWGGASRNWRGCVRRPSSVSVRVE